MDKRRQQYFMGVATLTAGLSYAEKLKVGAVAVRNRRIICTGYNGTGQGEDNCCEDWDDKLKKLVTRPTVSHAERNLIDFAAAEGIALRGASLFVTHSPCIQCARAIKNVGFKTIYYKALFSHQEGLEYLKSRRGVKVRRVG